MAGVFGEDLDPLIGAFAFHRHRRFERLYCDGKTFAVDVPEDFAWGAVDLEGAVLDFGGRVGGYWRGWKGGRGIVYGGKLDREISGKGGNIVGKVDRGVGCVGRDDGGSTVVDAGFGAFKAGVDEVFCGVEGVVDDEGFASRIRNFPRSCIIPYCAISGRDKWSRANWIYEEALLGCSNCSTCSV